MRQIYLYPIKIEACEEGGFLAICPILQGCYAEGKTIEEAVENLKNVIKIVLEYKKKYVKKFSIPRVSFEKRKILGELNVAVVK